MKHLFLLILFNSTIHLASAQFIHQSKIIDFYGQSWFDNMQANNPGILFLMDNYIDHGFVVLEISDSKYFDCEELTTIPLTDKTQISSSVQDFLSDYNGQEFNPLKYQFFPGIAIQVYRLKGQNKIIMISSHADLIDN